MPDDYVVTEGNTVEEAVAKALKVLNITKSQAKVEILDEGNKGFLGLGSKRAKVKVSVSEVAAAEMELTDILIDLDIRDEAQQENYRPKVINDKYGIAEVKDGQVVIRNPIAEGKYATIKPGQHIVLYVNGKKEEEETFVSEEDELKIETIADEPVSQLDISFSDDKVEAYLRYIKRPGAKYKLRHQGPTNTLMLLTEVDEILDAPPLKPEDVKRFLSENNVVKGIYEDAIDQLLTNANSKDAVLIAQGQKPVDGKDAYVRYPFMEKSPGDPNDEEGLFGRVKLVSVTQGDVIAIKMPAEEGHDGWTVTGEPLKVAQSADCNIEIKKGCELTDGGTKAVAVISGRPAIENVGSRSVLSVEPVYEVKNVDSTTGNIKFSGDVNVRGDVKEGFTVEAGGNIEINGDVTRATIRAGGSVTVHKMVLGSTIVAGGLAALYSSILPLLKDIKELLDKSFVVAGQLKGAPGFSTSDLQTKGDGQLLQLLMDSKFHSLPKAITDLTGAVVHSELAPHEEVVNTTNLLFRTICGLGPLHLDRIERLQTLAKATEQVLNLVAGCMSKVDTIRARYVQNSTLQSSGDVIIEGQGCYISSVVAGGEVIVQGSPGIARGVKITANRNVTVKELGSEFDTQTSVTIKGNGKISAELIHPNVTLQIGIEKFRIDKAYKNLDAYVNHEGRFIIDKLSADENH